MTPFRLERLARTALFAALLALPSGAALAADFDLGQLMQTLAQNRGNRAVFVEKKYLAVLDKPVESSGELLYVAPGRLEKRTLKPRPESVVLDGGILTVERGKQRHQLVLQDYPEVSAFVESIRGTLAGDRKALERVYGLHLEGSLERWTLYLLPNDPKMAALVSRIRIAGTKGEVRSVEILQADGDRSVMAIDKAGAP
ncbi:hypothetical protein OTERR_20440 [Oryzomicrobium terrae]|uniref:Acyltransferase n=1 Tax=Oryzomicrobium terrae TaxID=1735038 RepID=A0A5C1E9G2_9RHOO|nr:LolA-related protein [Oryzomicrobium terrae]QEL65520.1 hypothetical protein OTERR_20440 [Oryzomicrobium terrae]